MSENFFNNKIQKIVKVLILILFSCNIFASDDIDSYLGPGDNKEGYDSKNYTTNSISLDDRKGKKANLLQYVTIKQLGLPELIIPENNKITKEKIELGKKLFFD